MTFVSQAPSVALPVIEELACKYETVASRAQVGSVIKLSQGLDGP